MSINVATPIDRPKKDVFFALAVETGYNFPGTIGDLKIIFDSRGHVGTLITNSQLWYNLAK